MLNASKRSSNYLKYFFFSKTSSKIPPKVYPRMPGVFTRIAPGTTPMITGKSGDFFLKNRPKTFQEKKP